MFVFLCIQDVILVLSYKGHVCLSVYTGGNADFVRGGHVCLSVYTGGNTCFVRGSLCVFVSIYRKQ